MGESKGFNVTKKLNIGDKITYKFPHKDAAILYPTLGCPALIKIEENGNAWLEMIICCKNVEISPWQVAFHLRHIEWNRKDKSHVRDYRPLAVWEYFKKSFQHNKKERDMVRITEPKAVSKFLQDPGSLDEDDTFNLKFAHTNIFPWVLKQYENLGYQFLCKVAVNLGFEEPGRINGKMFNLIWLEKHMFEKSREKPKLMYEYANWIAENIAPEHKTKLSGFGDIESDSDEDFFTAKYHPVYISDKNYLDIGHITDIHLDTRMDMYGQSVASVVEVSGNEMKFEELKNGRQERQVENTDLYKPLKKIVTNFNQEFKKIGNKLLRESDLLVITGDLIDYNKGIHTDQTYRKTEKQPSKVWDELGEKLHKDKRGTSQKDRNWFLFYERLLELYDEQQKPIFTLLGNHDYYGSPTAPWPLWGAFWNGVYHMSLTRYETALCYGPGYNQSMDAIKNMDWEIKKEYIEWYSYFINPLSDMVVNYGNQSIFMVDWAQDQDVIGPKLEGAGGLQQAENVFDERIQEEDPFPIRNYSIYNSWKSSDAKIKILCMHPTVVCPRGEYFRRGNNFQL